MSSLPNDDDGIIDLNSLSRTRTAADAPLLFPSEPPPAAFAMDASGGEARPRASKGKLIAAIAGGVVFIVLAGVGLKLAFRGEEPVSLAKLAAAAPPPPTATPAPAPAAPPAASAAASADPAPASTSDDDPKPAKGKKGKSFSGGGMRRTSAPNASPAPARPVKAADPCGCHGNFDCNLRCAAGAK